MITKEQEFLEAIHKGLEATKDFNSFKHLFSKDSATKELANIRFVLNQIESYLKMSTFKKIKFPSTLPLKPSNDKFNLVIVRPAEEKYNKKTYLGFYIGDIALNSAIQLSEDSISCEWSNYNPAIYIPELGETVFGCESWWSQIESEEDFKKITDTDIENTWYVKLYRQMLDAKSKEEKDLSSEEK